MRNPISLVVALLCGFVVFPANSVEAQDRDMDFIADDAEMGVDTDLDGDDDDVDTDSDDDGVSDADEAGDTDLMTPPIDTDNDGVPDFRDTDSDGDGLTDAQEAGDADPNTPPRDTDDDGVPDIRDEDSDGDGLPDTLEAGGFPPLDSDGDGLPDYRDLDSDNDGSPDSDESADDLDRDDIPNYRDPDSDGDGHFDGVDVCPFTVNPDQLDLDNDGDGDLCDDDSDGDTIDDTEDNCPLIANREQADRDGNGVGDFCEFVDMDGDGFEDGLQVQGGGCSTGGTAPWSLALLMIFGLFLYRRRSAALVITLAVVLTPMLARAQVEEQTNIGGERFRLATDRDGIIGVEWAGVPAHLDVQGSFWIGHADDPLTLQGGSGGFPLIHRRNSGGFSLTVPLFDMVSLALDMPFTIAQGRELNVSGASAPLDELGGGLGDLRIIAKVQLLRQDRHGIHLAIIPAVSIPLGDAGSYLREVDWTFYPELALSHEGHGLRLSFNLGYHFRPAVDVLQLRVRDELFVRAGAAYRFAARGGPPIEVGVTVSLGANTSDAFERSEETPSEFQFAVTWDAHEYVSVFGVGGFGLTNAWSTPDWRGVVGIRAGLISEEPDPCAFEEEDMDGFEDDDGCPDPDNDEDGILDVVDECPLEPEDMDGFEDEDGCADYDNDEDGVLDDVDQCVSEPEVVNGFEDDDGCPDEVPDPDGDGFRGQDDQCPMEAEDVDGVVDTDGCPETDADDDQIDDAHDRCPEAAGPTANGGCPDTDGDGDGLVDRLDNCPTEAGTAENSGCVAPQLVRIEAGVIRILDKVYFASGSATIRRRSFALLANLSELLNAHPEIHFVEIGGHTDDRGNDGRNLALSQRRADSVVAWLSGHQVDPRRLTAVGYGETRPIQEGHSRAAREANRRVEFLIVEPQRTETPIRNTRDSTTPESAPTSLAPAESMQVPSAGMSALSPAAARALQTNAIPHVRITPQGPSPVRQNVEFAPQGLRLRPRANAHLDAVAQTLQANPVLTRIIVEGHAAADERGAVPLARRRAAAVVDALVRRGIARERLEAVGLGASRPLVDAARSRRVELRLPDVSAQTEPTP